MESTFTFLDYSLVIIMLLVTICVGIYYGFFKKQSTATEYLLGGKNMGTWSIALSLISSILSPVPIVMYPAEIYTYGAQYTLSLLSLIVSQLLSCYIYLPVFYKLQITSTYEYLELRFNKKIRIFASILYTLFMILYLPFTIYIPGLTIALVTGSNTHYLTPVVCSVCIFYTTLGGLKAVVWTDVVQCVIMLLSIFIVLILGITVSGGMEHIWNMNYQGGRLQLSFSPDITKRDTVWTHIISYIVLWMSLITVSQGAVQKYLSLPSYREIKGAAWISTIGLLLALASSFFTGFVIYAKYSECDPLTSHHIKAIDQLLPYFFLDVGRKIPGLPGLFASGILSASLSTLSASFNCLAATIYEDFISPFVASSISQKQVNFLLKVIVLTVGIICTGLVYIVEQLGSLLPVVFTCTALTGGPLTGLFTVGMLLPMVNSKGAMAGGITSLLVLGWIIFGSQWYQYKKMFVYPKLPTSVQGCNASTNMTTNNVIHLILTNDNVSFVYKISHFHYGLIAVVIVLIVSVLVSYFTKDGNERVNKDCITPMAQFLIPQRDLTEYSKIGKAVNNLKEEKNGILLQNTEKE